MPSRAPGKREPMCFARSPALSAHEQVPLPNHLANRPHVRHSTMDSHARQRQAVPMFARNQCSARMGLGSRLAPLEFLSRLINLVLHERLLPRRSLRQDTGEESFMRSNDLLLHRLTAVLGQKMSLC